MYAMGAGFTHVHVLLNLSHGRNLVDLKDAMNYQTMQSTLKSKGDT